MMRTITVVPAYGRDYTSSSKVIQAWREGKDFLVSDMFSGADGRYLSERDSGELLTRGFTHVNIRYAKLTKVQAVTIR